MMIEVYVCDFCQKQSKEHYYDEEGWVVIRTNSSEIIITEGRDSTQCAKTKFTKMERDHHFCCIDHFRRFIQKEAGK